MMNNDASAPLSYLVMGTYNSKTELTPHIDVGSIEAVEKLGPYVPAEHRPKETATSSAGALAHLLKASLGSGVLAMPLAFRNAGLVVGVVGTAVVGAVCTHGLCILVRCSQEVCVEARKPALGYADTCQLVFQMGPKPTRRFAPVARAVADWALCLTHMGACCVYIVIISESFRQVSHVYGGPDWSVEIFCVMCLVPLVPLTQITKLKYLVPFSALANLVWLVSIGITLYYCLEDIPSFDDRELSTSISSLPLFISTSLFAMEGVGVVMPMENEMAKPQQFLGCPGVLNIAMVLVVTLYAFIGLIGYLKYGDDVRGSLTLNLPPNDVLAQVAKLLVAVVLFFSYTLIYYIPVDVVWRRVERFVPASRQRSSIALLRFLGVLLTVGLACAVPRLEVFMDLVGAICLSTLGLMMPALVETAWYWNKGLGCCYWLVWKNAVMTIIALVALVSGVTYTIKEF